MDHDYYLRRAYHFAWFNSDDPDTKNGAVIVLSDAAAPASTIGTEAFGANRFPRGVFLLAERLERPAKYSFMEHAERDAIFYCLRLGVDTDGATMYCPWFACTDCAKAIIAARIGRVVGHKQAMDRTTDRWRETIDIAHQMLREAGVAMEFFDGPVGARSLFDGQILEV